MIFPLHLVQFHRPGDLQLRLSHGRHIVNGEPAGDCERSGSRSMPIASGMEGSCPYPNWLKQSSRGQSFVVTDLRTGRLAGLKRWGLRGSFKN